MTQATTCVAAHRATDVMFSPNGKSVAITSNSWGDTLQLFDIDSGTARWKHRASRGGVFTKFFSQVSFSADGNLLAVGGDNATILAADDGHIVLRRRGPSGEHAVETAISPDGTWLIAVRSGRVRVYDVGSGAETLRFRVGEYCNCVRYSPDGTRIAMLGGDGIQVLDAASFQLQEWDAASFHRQVARTRPWSPIARLQNVPANTNRMQFGGCSHVLVTAASNDSVIRVWDVASGTLTGLCDTAAGTKQVALGDGCGRVALTSSADRTLRVWDVATGQERTRVPIPLGFRLGAVNSGATKLAASSGRKFVQIWSIAGGHQQQPAPDAAAPDDWCPRCGAG